MHLNQPDKIAKELNFPDRDKHHATSTRSTLKKSGLCCSYISSKSLQFSKYGHYCDIASILGSYAPNKTFIQP